MTKNFYCLDTITTNFKKKHLADSKISFIHKLKKYVLKPQQFLKTIKFHIFDKRKIEINWDERVKKMGLSSVLSSEFNLKEQKKINIRHEKLIKIILKKLNIKKKSKILDYGCGYGRFEKLLSKYGTYTGLDNSKEVLKLIKKKKGTSQFYHLKSFLKRDFKGYFDIIFIFSVLGGIPQKKLDKIKKILEILLKKNGIIFFIEMTGKHHIEGIWRTRTKEHYIQIFNNFRLTHKYFFEEDGRIFNLFYGKRKLKN